MSISRPWLPKTDSRQHQSVLPSRFGVDLPIPTMSTTSDGSASGCLYLIAPRLAASPSTFPTYNSKTKGDITARSRPTEVPPATTSTCKWQVSVEFYEWPSRLHQLRMSSRGSCGVDYVILCWLFFLWRLLRLIIAWLARPTMALSIRSVAM